MWDLFMKATPVVVILAALLMPGCTSVNEDYGWRFEGLDGSIEYGTTNVTNQEIYDFLVDHDNLSVIQVNGNANSMPFYYISFEFEEWPGYENDYTFDIYRYDDDVDVRINFYYESELDISGERREDVLDRIYDRFHDENKTAWDLMNAIVLEFNDLLDDEPEDLELEIDMEETYYYD